MLAQSDLEILALPLLGIGGFFDSIDAYHNVSNGHMLPVWFSQSCLSAAFDYRENAGPLEWALYGFGLSDCIGEALLHNPRGGAIAYIGAARITYGDVFPLNFFGCFFASKVGDFSPGLSLYYARLAVSSQSIHTTNEIERKVFSTYNLLGDPEFSTRVPSSVSVSPSQQKVVLGKNLIVTGLISPVLENTTVLLTYVRPNGSNVSHTVQTTASSYSDSFSPDIAGDWKVSAYWDGDIDHKYANSPTSSFTVLATLTVQAPYSGISIKIDGLPYTSDSTGKVQAIISAGAHTIEAPSQVQMNSGTRVIFTNWNDGAPSNPRTSTVDTDLTLGANYKTQFYLAVKTNPSGITSISGEGWYDSGTSVSLNAPKVSGYDFTTWLVNDSTFSGNPVKIEMIQPYTAIANYQLAENKTPTPSPTTSPTSTTPPPSSSPTPTPSSTPTATPQPRQGCIIATAAYGSEMAPEVAYMRYVRDDMIGSNEVGRSIVNGWNTFYYSWSTPLAQFISTHSALQPVFRVLLLPLVGTIHATASIYNSTALVNLTFASIIGFLFAAISSITIYLLIPLLAFQSIYERRFRRLL